MEGASQLRSVAIKELAAMMAATQEEIKGLLVGGDQQKRSILECLEKSKKILHDCKVNWIGQVDQEAFARLVELVFEALRPSLGADSFSDDERRVAELYLELAATLLSFDNVKLTLESTANFFKIGLTSPEVCSRFASVFSFIVARSIDLRGRDFALLDSGTMLHAATRSRLPEWSIRALLLNGVSPAICSQYKKATAADYARGHPNRAQADLVVLTLASVRPLPWYEATKNFAHDEEVVSDLEAQNALAWLLSSSFKSLPEFVATQLKKLNLASTVIKQLKDCVDEDVVNDFFAPEAVQGLLSLYLEFSKLLEAYKSQPLASTLRLLAHLLRAKLNHYVAFSAAYTRACNYSDEELLIDKAVRQITMSDGWDTLFNGIRVAVYSLPDLFQQLHKTAQDLRISHAPLFASLESLVRDRLHRFNIAHGLLLVSALDKSPLQRIANDLSVNNVLTLKLAVDCEGLAKDSIIRCYTGASQLIITHTPDRHHERLLGLFEAQSFHLIDLPPIARTQTPLLALVGRLACAVKIDGRMLDILRWKAWIVAATEREPTIRSLSPYVRNVRCSSPTTAEVENEVTTYTEKIATATESTDVMSSSASISPPQVEHQPLAATRSVYSPAAEASSKPPPLPPRDDIDHAPANNVRRNSPPPPPPPPRRIYQGGDLLRSLVHSRVLEKFQSANETLDRETTIDNNEKNEFA